MRNFKLIIYASNKVIPNKYAESFDANLMNKIIITDFDCINYVENTNLFSTFNEKFSIGDNDQSSLTFSIAKYIEDENRIQNPLLKLLPIGSKITLLMDDDTLQYDYIVKGIKPKTSRSNIIYEYTCQDEVSYQWPRLCLGYSYSTIEKGTVQTLYEIANEVLTECHLSTHWQVANYMIYANSGTGDLSTKITLEVENSNPYNVIIEGCNSLNCSLRVDYATHQINFFQKDRAVFSGYRYRPETNLRSIDVDYSGENLATLLHVVGGEDEYGMLVPLVPKIPDAIANWLLSHQKDWLEDTIVSFSDNWYSEILKHPDFTPIYNTQPTIEKLPIAPIPPQPPFKDSDDKQAKEQKYKEEQAEYIVDYFKYENSVRAHNEFYKKQRSEQQENEIFCTIADRNPHLGQFLLDFSFFKLNNMLTSWQEEDLNNLFNVQMRKNNIMLKLYTPIYYKLIWDLNNKLIDIKTYLEVEYANYNKIRDYYSNVKHYKNQYSESNDSQSIYDDYMDKIKPYEESQIKEHQRVYDYISAISFSDCWKQLYGTKIVYNKEYIPELKNLDKEIENYKQIRNESKEEYFKYQEEFKNSCGHYYDSTEEATGIADLKLADIIGNIVYNLNRYNYAIQFCGEYDLDDPNTTDEYRGKWDIHNNALKIKLELQEQLIDTNFGHNNGANPTHGANLPELVDGMLIYLKKYIINNIFDNQTDASSGEPEDDGIHGIITMYTEKNNKLWEKIYKKYSLYIYESTYENSDELDSTSLFNQAVIYYEDYRKPKSSYSIAILDLSVLEAVSIPRLQVGNRIRVYNPELDLNDGQVNNISFTDNELIITDLNFDLRQSGNVSVTVEKITQYQQILQKLIKTVK